MTTQIINKNKIDTSLPVVSHGSLDDYIRFVHSIPLLTQDEEYELAQKWVEQEDVEAARMLVLSHLRLVVSIARGYLGYGLPLADIIQEGTIGLMKAVKRFNPKANTRLVTYATHWIRAEINDYVIKNWRIVKTVTTKNQRKLFFNLRSLKNDLGHLSEIDADRIAKELNVSRDEVVEMNTRLTGADVGILADSEDDFAPGDWLFDENNIPEQIVERKNVERLHSEGIEKALEMLDDRSRDIIINRWLVEPEEQLTLHDLAKKYHISAERVRQIELKAMEKMKQYLGEYR